jgi:hypothetical protein
MPLGVCSLAGGLYLGIYTGYGLMWLLPLAMVLGVIALSTIGYLALSIDNTPFRAIAEFNPVLAWGWAIAALTANLVWCIPQFAIGSATMQYCLFPGLSRPVCLGTLLVLAIGAWWVYEKGGRGLKVLHTVLRIMVGIFAICLLGVLLQMSDELPWSRILSGFALKPSHLIAPADDFAALISQTGSFSAFWHDLIVARQREIITGAAAAAVGINMSFLLPYAWLKRGWDKDFRGLGSFQLWTALAIPFVLASSCLVIVAAGQFHAQYEPGLLGESADGGAMSLPTHAQVAGYQAHCDARLGAEFGDAFVGMSEDQKSIARAGLSLADRQLAAMLIKRDLGDVVSIFERLGGGSFSRLIVGIGVLGMAISCIIMLMSTNGLVLCEILGASTTDTSHRLGCLLAVVVGAAGPVLWPGDGGFWLTVPTSVFGMVLLPIAYWTFFALMNNRRLLGDALPQGSKRIVINSAMFVAAGLATLAAGWVLVDKSPAIRSVAFTLIGIFVLLAIISQVMMNNKHKAGDSELPGGK